MVATKVRAVTVVIFLIIYQWHGSYAQLGLIQSVSKYSSCRASPLGTQGDACGNGQFEVDQEVIVIRAQVKPSSRAGVQNLVFELRDIPDVDETRTYDTSGFGQNSLACQGVPVGGNCSLTSQVLVISFDATRLFAGYQLERQMKDIPACYSLQVAPDLLNTCIDPKGKVVCDQQQQLVENYGNRVGIYTEQPCSTLGGVSSLGSLQANLPVLGNNKIENACPTSLDGTANEFYDPPETYSIDVEKTGICPLIYCLISDRDKDREATWTLNTPLRVPYMCSVWDIKPSSQGVMAADVVVSSVSYDADVTVVNERLQVSSLNGGRPVESTTQPVVAQLLRINKALGVAGPLTMGAVITCNSGGVENNGPMLNDAPGRLSPAQRAAGQGSVRDDFYNPYSETNPVEGSGGQAKNIAQRCTLPVSQCRRMMLPKWYLDDWREATNQTNVPDEELKVGHYYFATQARLPEYGSECNQNGMDPSLLFQSIPILDRFCVTQALKGGTAGECIPGYPQKDLKWRTATPVQANAVHASFLAAINTNPSLENDVFTEPLPNQQIIPGADFVPLDYLPLNPNYWLAHGMLIREGLFGSTSEASMDIMIVVQAKQFLGEVTTRTTGVFIEGGMSCDATTSGAGRVSWTSQNQGTLGGIYYVVPTFRLPPGGVASTDIYVNLPRINLNLGTNQLKNVSYATRSWEARSNVTTGGRDYGFFEYTYSGPLRNSLEVTLDLYIPAGSNGAGFARVSTITTGCTITRGVVQDLAGREPGGKADYSVDLSGYYECVYWYNNIFRCWGHYDRTWKLLVNLMTTITVIIGALFAVFTGILAVCVSYLRGRKTVELSRSDLQSVVE
jgi:hypothetical protein